VTEPPAAPRPAPGPSPWLLGAVAIAALVLAPIVALVVFASRGSADLWQHLLAHVLPDAIRDTALLLAGVGLLTAVVGTGTAWLVTAYDFPGRRILDWALLLPLAVPTYIVAYAYLDILHPVGPVQTALRGLIGVESPRDFRLPDVRSMAGCIMLLGFVLYPYVYLTTRAMFLMQAANLIDAARTLGAGRWSVFFRVALPLARPAVAIGSSLALMEALNDIGASEFLGVRTLTVSIYTTWVTRSDLPGAAQIALAMLAVVVCLVLVERWARRQRRYANDAQSPRPLSSHRLTGFAGLLALAIASIPVALGFLVPAAYLADETISRVRFAGISNAIVSETVNTVSISLVATIVTLLGGIAVVYTGRVSRGPWPAFCARVVSLGYAVPGTVLAIGLLPVVTGLDRLLDGAAVALTGASTGLVLLSSGTALIYAYVARFMAVAAGGVEAGFSRVSPSLDDAARTLGETAGRRLRRIHLPMTRPALATAALLVFVDCMKELPATLLLRPIGFETLATHLYGDAARGTYEDGAMAALLIVAAGLVPVLILARVGRLESSSRPGMRDRRATDGLGEPL
jgi:iron(III) transport system permease protein